VPFTLIKPKPIKFKQLASPISSPKERTSTSLFEPSPLERRVKFSNN
jgi:hypothetical protein